MGREKFSGTIEVDADSDTAKILHEAFYNGKRLLIMYGETKVGEAGLYSFDLGTNFVNCTRTVSCEFRELPKVESKPEWDDIYRGYVIRDTDAGSGYIGSFKGRSWVTEKKNAERFTKQEALNLIQDPCSNLGEGSFTIEEAT